MVRAGVELIGEWIEDLAVLVISFAIVFGLLRYVVHLVRHVDKAYERFKVRMGRALLLALELMVAADIIDTVVLEPSMRNTMKLGLIVMIRTFLSWSIIVEIEGRWPWQPRTGQ